MNKHKNKTRVQITEKIQNKYQMFFSEKKHEDCCWRTDVRCFKNKTYWQRLQLGTLNLTFSSFVLSHNWWQLLFFFLVVSVKNAFRMHYITVEQTSLFFSCNHFVRKVVFDSIVEEPLPKTKENNVFCNRNLLVRTFFECSYPEICVFSRTEAKAWKQLPKRQINVFFQFCVRCDH